MAFLFTPNYQKQDGNGLPLSGATLTFYRAGTTTKITIYQDSQATTPHANPITADATGSFPAIFLTTVDNYKFILKTAAAVTVQTVDRIPVAGNVNTETLAQAVDVAEAFAAQAAASAALSAPTGVANKKFAGNAVTTAFTLDAQPSTSAHVIVGIEGQLQEPETAYTISGFTLTFTAPPPGDGVVENISTRILSLSTGELVPPDLSVTTAKLGALSVTGAKIGAKAVTYAKIQDVSATDKLLGRSTAGAGVIEEITLTAAGRALIDDVDATAQRVTLGLAIGTNVQAAAKGFSAHKNAVDQGSVTSDTYTKVTFGTEAYDTGVDFDTTLSRWTPPAGLISIDCQVLFTGTIAADVTGFIAVYKNGAAYKIGRATHSVANSTPLAIACKDNANGTDYYEIFAKTVGSSLVVNGGITNTWFMGSR